MKRLRLLATVLVLALTFSACGSSSSEKMTLEDFENLSAEEQEALIEKVAESMEAEAAKEEKKEEVCAIYCA